MTGKLKKVLLPNFPYLLFAWLFDKLCQAVRLSPGADASEKLLRIAQGFTEAFASLWLSLHPLDLLLGVAGAALVRLAVYLKAKNAKKYRCGVEYGSARWGRPEDIAPYIDPVPDWNIPLTRTESLTMTSRPKDPKTARNKNILVIGGSGSGKTRFSMYAVYMSTLGNRPDLFPSSGYVPKYVTKPPAKYEIPAEYLSDERFATLITEAEKYLGFPYVWGGSSPSTSFDCSGFVSYVLTSSGLCNTGRLGAQGLYNISTPVSEPRPGDLVFFVGTYDTPGVSHVGFYVGDGMLLHCGDPIQYTSLNTNYWQSHLYAYGRPPYN